MESHFHCRRVARQEIASAPVLGARFRTACALAVGDLMSSCRRRWCLGAGAQVVRMERTGETCWGGWKGFRCIRSLLAGSSTPGILPREHSCGPKGIIRGGQDDADRGKDQPGFGDVNPSGPSRLDPLTLDHTLKTDSRDVTHARSPRTFGQMLLHFCPTPLGIRPSG